jgi:hypothetical protein
MCVRPQSHISVAPLNTYTFQKRVSVKQRVRDTVSGHISLSAYEQVATSRFMCKDHQKQPDVTRKGHGNNFYKYGFKLLYEITVVRVPVKVRKTRSLKLGPAAARP